MTFEKHSVPHNLQKVHGQGCGDDHQHHDGETWWTPERTSGGREGILPSLLSNNSHFKAWQFVRMVKSSPL